jgi:hypothetical protein
MISREVLKEGPKLFPMGIAIGEDQVAWANIAHRSNRPIQHIGGTFSVVSVNRHSSSQLETNISIAKKHLEDNAKSVAISSPSFYQYGGIKMKLRKVIPRKGRFWRALRAALKELTKINVSSM